MPKIYLTIPELTPQEMERFWSHVKIQEPNECWPWTASKNSHGYGNVGVLRKNIKKRMYSAHRVAFAITHAETVAGLCVCHTCDNPTCCNPRHLFTDTEMGNTRDKMNKNRQNRPVHRGELNTRAKLTDNIVANIKLRLREGCSGRRLAKEFNVCTATISQIKNGKRWQHITPD